MKNIILSALITALICSFAGCVKTNNTKSEISESTESEISETVSVDPDKNASKKYKFLNSKYTVSAIRIMHGIEYHYEYYFQKGTVAGLKQTVILLDPDSAQLYYDDIIGDCPEAHIDGVTVIHYMGEGASCYGDSLEMLEFRLETAGFEYTVNFDRESFIQRYESKVVQ